MRVKSRNLCKAASVRLSSRRSLRQAQDATWLQGYLRRDVLVTYCARVSSSGGNILPHSQVLVAIVNNLEDMRFVREAGWYRIRVSSAQRWLKDRWPPRMLAFYQTKVFGSEAYAIKYYAVVQDIRIASRMNLFPDTPSNHPKADRRYYQLQLGELQTFPQPIISRRLRRIVFIPTTLEKFRTAVEINDLLVTPGILVRSLRWLTGSVTTAWHPWVGRSCVSTEERHDTLSR